MKIIKRSGSEVTFDISKIMAAVSKANMEVVHSERLSEEQIETISNNVESICKEMNRSLSVEEIQDLVENQIMNLRAFAVARKYITYRYKRALVRKSNSTDEQILSLLECNNEEVKQENSNKNPTVNSVQRDYMAGEVSKDITARFLLPHDITVRILLKDFFFQQILLMHMSRDLYISTMQITLPSICITAVLLILRICYRMEL
jgi:anaerobic ribonucleoside-triphosphate reductase